MAVALRVVLVGVYIPMVANAVCLCVVKDAEAEIIEHGFHAERVSLCDVVLHHRSVVVAVGDVLVALEQIVGSAAERPMLLVLPVIELQTVDMAAVEQRQFGGYHVRSTVVSVRGNEAIARESCPVARHIHADSGVDGLLVVGVCGVNVSHIACVVGLRSCPCPRCRSDVLVRNHVRTVTIAHMCR